MDKPQKIWIAVFMSSFLIVGCNEDDSKSDNGEEAVAEALAVSNKALVETDDYSYTHTFTSTRTGTVSYSNYCSTSDDTVAQGINVIEVNATYDPDLYIMSVPPEHLYKSCSFTVTDETGNTSAPINIAYIKLDSDGEPLPVQSKSWNEAGSETNSDKWSCVKDLVTNLVWEVKKTDAGLRDKNWTYSWYDTNPATNGFDDYAQEGDTIADWDGFADWGNCFADGGGCDTESLVADVNVATLCGASDWRVPSKTSLNRLMIDRYEPGAETINEAFFPNTVSGGTYWTSTPYSGGYGSAYAGDFAHAMFWNPLKNSGLHVRLVRGGD